MTLLNEDSPYLNFIIASRDICESCQCYSGPKFILFELRDASGLLRRNVILTESERISSESNIIRAEDEILRLDTEIAHLQHSLEALNDRRSRLQEFTQRERALISPIRKLPIELLQKVFYHAQELTKSDLRTAFVRVAARVSAYWRTVAHSYGDLWTNIQVTKYTYKHDVKRHALGPFIRKCISLSNNAPLTIRLHGECTEEALGNSCMREIGENAHRWKNISLDWRYNHTIYSYVPRNIIFSCLVELEISEITTTQMIDLYPAPLLRYLSFDSIRNGGSRLTFQSAPSLTHLNILNVKYPVNFFSNLRWSQITHFTSKNSQYSRDELSNILQKMSHLQTLYLDEKIDPTRPVVLQQLEVLELYGSSETNALDTITAPSLKELTLECYCEPSFIIAFLRKNRCSMQKLQLCAPIFDEAWQLDELNGVKELNLRLVSFMEGLGWLTIGEPAVRGTLFPQLESLDINVYKLGDEVKQESALTLLISGIRSRIRPVQEKMKIVSQDFVEHSTGRLKFVNISFYERPGQTIASSVLKTLGTFLSSDEVLGSEVTIHVRDSEGVMLLSTM